MRARRSRQQWQTIIGTFERSGQTLAGFCGPRGIRPATLKWWQWYLRSKAAGIAESASAGENVRLVAIDVVAPPSATSAAVGTLAILVAGAELRIETGTDVAYVSELVMALRSRC